MPDVSRLMLPTRLTVVAMPASDAAATLEQTVRGDSQPAANQGSVSPSGFARALPSFSRDEAGLIGLTLLSWGVAGQIGRYSEPGFLSVVAAAAMLAIALASEPGRVRAPVWIVAVLALPLASAQPLRYWGLSVTLIIGLEAVMVVAAMVAVVARRRPEVATALGVLGLAAAAYTLLIWHWGEADIDVFGSLQGATSNLLRGHNPYDYTFPAYTFPAQLVSTHFQYGPLVPVLLAPARLIGDVRIMSVVGLVLVGLAIARLAGVGRGRIDALRLAAVGLASPFLEPMVRYAWVDGLMMAGFCGWLALRRDHPRWAVIALGGALAIKPTFAVALIPFLLWSMSARRETVFAGLSATAFSLPFALATGLGSYYHDVIGVQVEFGTRYDALTLTAWLYDRFAITALPAFLGIIVAGAIVLMLAMRRPSDVAELCYGGALLSTVAFVFAKWAFLNYYFIPAVLVMLALATRGIEVGPDGDVVLPGPVQGLGSRLAALVPSRLRGATAP